MSDKPASVQQILPRPRRVSPRPGVFRSGQGAVVAYRGGGQATTAARRLAGQLRSAGLEWCVHGDWHEAGGSAVPKGTTGPGRILVEQVRASMKPPQADQWYAIEIRPKGITLRGAEAAGLRHGATTLGQLMAAGGGAIRAMDIEDWPDFPVRGVMLDISRDKVPTMTTLRGLIDLLAGWKINHLQPYTEHTFAYAGHERVWRGASPMTGSQIEELDRYCGLRGVELVPNQNSFGHLERWLKHPRYARLAEATGPWRTPWGDRRDQRTTLNPLDPGSIRLVASLYDQLLPHFASRLFNVGCDETWELGQGRSAGACRKRGVGRVYLDFLLKIHRAVRQRGRRMMFWADIAQQHPELMAELPDDMIPLIWGYEADHPFDVECARVARRGLAFHVCPGTSSWCSFGGRTANCLANLRSAAASGRRHGAAGYLITDWGDYGHRQYLPASYPGFLYGAAVSWCAETNAGLDVPGELSRRVFGDPSGAAGGLWCAAGAIHELSGVSLKNRTILFACMQAALSEWPSIGGLITEREKPVALTEHLRRLALMEERSGELLVQAERLRCGAPDERLAREELLGTLLVLRHACRRGRVMVDRQRGRDIRARCRELAADMTGIMERHRTLWPARNRRGGLAASQDYYRRNLSEYQNA